MRTKLNSSQKIDIINRALSGGSVTEICKDIGISRVLFYRLLQRYKKYGEKGLEERKKGRPRKYRAQKLTTNIQTTNNIISAHERLRMVEEVVNEGRRPSVIAKKYQVSRPTLYKWIKRYKKSQQTRIHAVENKTPKYSRYYRQAPELYEDAVLSLVTKFPEYGVRKIVANLPQIGKKPILGHHGVQNVLQRHNLSTLDRRMAYAKSQETVITSSISGALSKINNFFAIPLETRQKVVRFSAVFFLTSFFTVVLFGMGGAVTTTFIGVPLVKQIGLTLALVALFMGSVFFVYSLKYYLTLVIVLSFSQQEDTNTRLRGNILHKLLGLVDENTDKSKLDQKQAVGLTPNLDHIKLSRYPFISVQIPFYNEKNVAERAIAASTNFDYKGDYEVIVCDDSTDETFEIVRNYQKQYLAKNCQLKISKGDGWDMSEVEVRPGVILKHLHRTTRSGYKGASLKLALTLVDKRTEFVSIFDADFVPYPDSLDLFLKYFKSQNGGSENYTSNNIAAVQGYQWHVLNKSENWITRGVRSEYAGSYVIERSGQEIYGGLKHISGSVYMIRRDVLEEVGWRSSITEDYELTLRLYNAGYKVVYTPYIQAPAECVSTLKRLIRQRMRWAEGHSFNVKLMWKKLLIGRWELANSSSTDSHQVHSLHGTKMMRDDKKVFIPSPLTVAEKVEFVFNIPYYLQAFLFLIGTFAWLLSEAVFQVRLPFWTTVWGWSLILTNMFSLPLVNAVGLFLEESEERDYLGLLSFVALSYILVPFQAYSSVKGFIQKEEGPWFRTPKTGRITDVFARGRFYRFISGILPKNSGNRNEALSDSLNTGAYSQMSNSYLSMVTANNIFNTFSIKRKTQRWVGKLALTSMVAVSMLIVSYAPYIPSGKVSVAAANTGAILADKAIDSDQPVVNKAGKALNTNNLETNKDGFTLTSDNKDFKITDSPSFRLQARTNFKDRLAINFGNIFKGKNEKKARIINAKVVNHKGNEYDVGILDDKNGYELVVDSNNLSPGLYDLVVEDNLGNSIAQDFSWGVLAINTNKSIYTKGENAELSFAVLNEDGEMVCDAKLELGIRNSELGIDETLSTNDGSIRVTPGCNSKEMLLTPDYEAEYKLGSMGIYELTLTATTHNGSYTITDSIEVRKSVEFDIERISATRIYPLLTYPVIFNVIPEKDFQGVITETVPADFAIVRITDEELKNYSTKENSVGSSKFLDIKKQGGVGIIEWQVNWKKGETYHFGYKYDAPDKSPALYTLGPLQIDDFSEARVWQIAVDAISGITARNYAVENSSDTTIAVSPDAAITVGKIAIVSCVTDNTATSDGPSTDHSLSDTDGHTWNKVFEETDSAGAAADGSTTSLWWTKVTSEIGTGDSITLTLGTARSDKIIAIVEATVGAGNTFVAIPSSAIDHSNSATSLSDVQSGLTNREYLFFGLFGAEGEDTAKTPIANYTEQHDRVSTTTGTAAVNVQMHVGTRILTGTGDTWTSSAVTFTNGIQSLTAFYEVSSTITVSGNVYNFGTSSALTECDASGATHELSLRVGSTTYTTSCDASDSGAYSFTSVTPPSGGSGMVVWIDDAEASETDGAAVIQYDGSGDSTGNSFYDDAVTILTDDGSGVTIDMMDAYDSGGDADIPYTATSGSPDTLTVSDNYTLLIPSGEVFAPGGNLNNGSGAGIDNINISGTYTAATGESILVSGTWTQSGTFTSSTSTVTFDAPGATTEDIVTTGSGAFNNVVFNDGEGGATWEIEDPLDVDGNFTITGGTVDVVSGEDNQINVGGNWTNDDTFVERSGKVVFDTSTTATLDSNCSDVGTCTNENFYDLELSKASSGNTVTLTNFGIRVTNTLTLTTGTLVQGAYNVRVEGATAVSVASNGIWSNTSTGDVILGGSFANSGIVTMQGTTSACGETDAISITSTSGGSQRSWTSLGGTFNMNDVSVQDQGGSAAITVYSGTNVSGNNSNWVFEDCVTSSTSSSATGHSFQRKTFYDDENETFWRFYHDGDEVDIEYSKDSGDTWSSTTALAYDTNDFSVWWKAITVGETTTEYVWMAVTTSDDILVRRGTLGSTSVTWDSEANVVSLNGTGASDTYSYPYISLDDANYMWVGARHYNGTNYTYKTVRSDASDTGNATWSGVGFGSTVPVSQVSADQTNANVFGNIVPLNGQDMYAAFVSNTLLQGCVWDHSDAAWEDSDGASCVSTGGSAPVFRGESSSTFTTAASVVVNKPTGTVDNDIMLAIIYKENTAAVTAPSGWNYIDGETPTTDHDVIVYWKRASSEGSNYTWSWTGSTWSGGAIMSYSGAITTGDPVNTYSANSASSGQTLTATGVTTSVDNTTIVALGAHWNTGTYSGPTGYTVRATPQSMRLSDKTQASAGATGDAVMTTSANSSSWTAHLVALKPAGTPGSRDAIDTVPSGLSKNISAVVDTTNYDVHLLFVDDESTDQVSYKRWDKINQEWDVTATLVAGGTSDTDAYVSLSYDTDASDLYAIWIDTSTNHIFYTACDISTQCSLASDWIVGVEEEIDWHTETQPTNLTSNYSSGTNVFAQWSDGSGSPYSVEWDIIVVPEWIWLIIVAGPILPLMGKFRKKRHQ
ncbi:glycosyltransferase [Candidatus Woesebacteria bacterium]|nr:MAG: glycosyltransferase [Candidatus Woesebacteria bacterium]